MWPFDRYIRKGDEIQLTRKNCRTSVKRVTAIEGWGKYAAVRVGVLTIRRDQIQRDFAGNWYYRLEEMS